MSFLFISYSHDDRKYVQPVLDAFDENNVTYWNDQQIQSGSIWSDVIAERIMKADTFIAFISDHYLDSINCMKEIHWAKDNNRTVYTIMLEEVDWTRVPGALGIAMYSAELQRIYREHYFDETKFIEDILNMDFVQEAITTTLLDETKESTVTAVDSKNSRKKDSGNEAMPVPPSANVIASAEIASAKAAEKTDSSVPVESTFKLKHPQKPLPPSMRQYFSRALKSYSPV